MLGVLLRTAASNNVMFPSKSPLDTGLDQWVQSGTATSEMNTGGVSGNFVTFYLAANQSFSITRTVTMPVNGHMTFYARQDDGASLVPVEVTVDGIAKSVPAIPFYTWTPISIPVSQGTHTIVMSKSAESPSDGFGIQLDEIAFGY